MPTLKSYPLKHERGVKTTINNNVVWYFEYAGYADKLQYNKHKQNEYQTFSDFLSLKNSIIYTHFDAFFWYIKLWQNQQLENGEKNMIWYDENIFF